MQVDLSDALMTEVNIEHAVVLQVRLQGHGVAMQGLADAVERAQVGDLTAVLYAAHRRPLGIVDRGQLLRKGTRTALVAADRCLHGQGVVWTLKVVDQSPGIEATLGVGQIDQWLAREHFSFKGAVEALVFTPGFADGRGANGSR